MIDESEYIDYPWKSVADQITTVRVKEGVTAIGSNCLGRLHALVNVELPRSLVKIKSNAFFESDALETVTIPAGVTEIEDEAFLDCTALREIRVSEENEAYRSEDRILFTKNGEQLLYYSAKRTEKSYAVPEGVKDIASGAFSGCAALEQVQLPDSLEKIAHYAFENTGLKYVKIPQGVKEIRYAAFRDCEKLTFAILPSGIGYLSDDILMGCPLARVDFEGTREEWEALFAQGSDNEKLENADVIFECGYQELRLPAELTAIGEAAFENGSFSHVRLGEKVVSIGARAFAGCGKLRFVYIPDACKSIASDAFEEDEFLVIVCTEGSAACRFAIDHGIAYLCD